MNRPNNYFKTQDIKFLQSKGLFKMEVMDRFVQTMDGGPAGLTPSNNVLPLGLLSELSPMLVEIITRARTAEQVIGKKMKVLDWAKNDLYVPAVELLGETKTYDDFDSGPASSVNPQYISRGHDRFSSKIQVGQLQEQQLSLSKIPLRERSALAAMEALAIKFNNTSFYGVAKPVGSSYPIYGLFNEPSLPAYKEAGFKQTGYTFEEVFAELRGMLQEVIANSGGHVTPDSDFTFAISNAHNAILATINPLGSRTVVSVLKETYPNIKFVYSPEMDTAYNNLPVLYLRAEVPQLANVAPTAILGFSELAISSAVEVHPTFTEQKVSSGTVGTIILKPYLWSRRYIAAA